MKIAQLVCVLPPYGGGLGTVAHEYAQGLFERGHESVVVTIENKKFNLQADKIYPVITERPWWQIGLGAILPKMRRDLKQFDILTLHWPFFGASLPTIFSRLFNSRQKLFIFYHQDLILPGWKQVFYRLYLKIYFPILFRLAEKIIVSSFDYINHSYIAKLFRKYPDKFVELPFGVSTKFSPKPKNPDFLTSLGFSATDRIVGFVGGLDSAHYFKGLEYLITAFESIPENSIKGLIVGAGNLKEQYLEQTQKKNLEQRLKFAGYVPDVELNDYYNAMDVLILPSIAKNEAFGLVLIEAMACGKPVITTNLAGVRTVFTDRLEGILIKPKDPLAIARAIRKILLDEAVYEQMSDACVKKVNARYRWPIVIDKLIELYTL